MPGIWGRTVEDDGGGIVRTLLKPDTGDAKSLGWTWWDPKSCGRLSAWQASTPRWTIC